MSHALLRSLLITLAAATSVVAASFAHAADAPQRPNILILLADDLGWRDVPWHGCDYAMPNLDALAKEGLRLESHYVHPMCSPTRAALLSGRYASRFGCTGAQNERVYPFDTITLPAALKSAGYTTAITGKWHLGSLPEWGPIKFGFDYSYGLLAGGCGPFDHHYKTGPYTDTWHRNCQSITEEGHVTDLIAGEAVKFLERPHTAPFFLYVPFTAVHIPIDEPQEWLDRNSHITDPGDRLHAATASHMDAAIGRVLAALDKSGKRDDTLVLFFSDNGGHGPTQNFDTKYPGKYPSAKVGRDNAPLRGLKTSLLEGGIRSASMIRWPGKLQPGVLDQPMHACDWMPTLAKLVGYQPPHDLRWDGMDILPVLKGERTTQDRLLYGLGTGGREQMVRRGPWKLRVQRKGDTELFNLVDDIGEEKNLADTKPELVSELKQLMAAAAERDGESKVRGDE